MVQNSQCPHLFLLSVLFPNRAADLRPAFLVQWESAAVTFTHHNNTLNCALITTLAPPVIFIFYLLAAAISHSLCNLSFSVLRQVNYQVQSVMTQVRNNLRLDWQLTDAINNVKLFLICIEIKQSRWVDHEGSWHRQCQFEAIKGINNCDKALKHLCQSVITLETFPMGIFGSTLWEFSRWIQPVCLSI